MKQMKIIPLLVFVAVLAFSVRLVDVVSGVSSLSGSAFAEDVEDSKESDDMVKKDEMEAPEGGLVFSDEDASDEMAEEDESIWRDSSDENPGYEAVRQELYKELRERRKTIETRERELQTREALLRAAEQEIDRKFQELSQLRQEIERLLETQSEEEKARVASLVKIYEGMKPKDAARIFDTLDLDILVSVVASMSERKLSPILAAMNPERARTITIMLAQQKQLPTLPNSN